MGTIFWTEERKAAAQESICHRIAEGESLRQICKHADLGAVIPLPNAQTVNQWLRDDTAFRDKYIVARQWQADLYADQILEVAESAFGQSKEFIQAARLKIDCLKWLAGKQHPRYWGDRQQIEMTANVDVRHLSLEQLQAEMAILLPQMQAAVDAAPSVTRMKAH